MQHGLLSDHDCVVFMQCQGVRDNGLILKYVSENSVLWHKASSLTNAMSNGLQRFFFYNSLLLFFFPFWMHCCFHSDIFLTKYVQNVCDLLQKRFPAATDVENVVSCRCNISVSLSPLFSFSSSTQKHQLLKEHLSWHCYFSSRLQRSPCRRVPQVVLSGS